MGKRPSLLEFLRSLALESLSKLHPYQKQILKDLRKAKKPIDLSKGPPRPKSSGIVRVAGTDWPPKRKQSADLIVIDEPLPGVAPEDIFDARNVILIRGSTDPHDVYIMDSDNRLDCSFRRIPLPFEPILSPERQSAVIANAEEEGKRAAEERPDTDPKEIERLNPYEGGTIYRAAWFTGCKNAIAARGKP
jgi:hypothetical protein